MGIKGRIATMLMALAIFGCKSGQTSSAASANGDAMADGAGGMLSSVGGGQQDVYVTDPTLNNMNAFRITIPAKWKFQGMVFQPGKCVKNPGVVFRSTSPDGLSFSEAMPPFGWVSGTGPRVANEKTADCLPMTQATTAQQFLDYVAKTLGADSVTAVPSEELNAKAQQGLRDAALKSAQQWANMHMAPPKQTVEIASTQVVYKNGPVSMKGLLTGQVSCTETTYPGMHSILRGMADTPPSTVDHCEGYVAYTAAPANQYDAVVRQWSAPGIGGHGGENDWFMAYVKRSNDENRGFLDKQNAAFKQHMAQNQADYDARFQMQKQFQDAMSESTQRSLKGAEEARNARSTAASDMVDFALDHRTVVNANGEIGKVSNQATTAWQNTSGTIYAAKDPTFNPNGVLAGSWTQTSFTHGNGSSF